MTNYGSAFCENGEILACHQFICEHAAGRSYICATGTADVCCYFVADQDFLKLQNAFRHGESWDFVNKAIEKCRRLNIEFSIVTAVMNVNYREIPRILARVSKEGCNLRLNIFKKVPKAGITKFALSYDEFWEAMAANSWYYLPSKALFARLCGLRERLGLLVPGSEGEHPKCARGRS